MGGAPIPKWSIGVEPWPSLVRGSCAHPPSPTRHGGEPHAKNCGGASDRVRGSGGAGARAKARPGGIIRKGRPSNGPFSFFRRTCKNYSGFLFWMCRFLRAPSHQETWARLFWWSLPPVSRSSHPAMSGAPGGHRGPPSGGAADPVHRPGRGGAGASAPPRAHGALEGISRASAPVFLLCFLGRGGEIEGTEVRTQGGKPKLAL